MKIELGFENIMLIDDGGVSLSFYDNDGRQFDISPILSLEALSFLYLILTADD